jgi:hypothetical protein
MNRLTEFCVVPVQCALLLRCCSRCMPSFIAGRESLLYERWSARVQFRISLVSSCNIDTPQRYYPVRWPIIITDLFFNFPLEDKITNDEPIVL